MSLIPDDIAGATIWMFTLIICAVMIGTVVSVLFDGHLPEKQLSVFEDVLKIMLGAVIGFVGAKLKK